ncbi:MAG TPA: hypothetical protein VHE13_07350 [Opitutus sp.]|nr:hypothetical protein [Opitutus sp.]
MAATLMAAAGLAAGGFAKVRTFDAGAFSVTVDLPTESWEGKCWPEFNTLRLMRHGGVRLFNTMPLDCYVYADRMADKEVPADLESWFARYMEQPGAFIDHTVFDKICRFEPARPSPITIGGYRVFQFNMRQRNYFEHGSTLATTENGVVYFLVLPGIEKHRTFFVFTGRESLGSNGEHRPLLDNVAEIVRGFRLNLAAAPAEKHH